MAEVFVEGLNAYLLVFARIGGMILFNPLLSRKNIPTQVKMALILGITILLTPLVGGQMPAQMNDLTLIFSMMKELLVGVACGFVFQVYYFLLFTAGDVIDMGFGLSMAKAFDPGTNIQISMSGHLFQLIFIMYFFATDSHLIFIRLIASSYDLVGIGAVTFGENVGSFLMTLFVSAFSLIMRLSLPFIAAAFVLEFAMGILMKLIPQINVFAVHFQIKIILGLVLLFAFSVPISNFMQNYLHSMLTNMQGLFQVV